MGRITSFCRRRVQLWRKQKKKRGVVLLYDVPEYLVRRRIEKATGLQVEAQKESVRGTANDV